MMALVLQRTPSHLRELDMSYNDLQDEGVELLCEGLGDPQCKLEKVWLSHCLITHKGCSFLAYALKSNPSYLKQLDLSYNHPGDSGVRELSDRLNDPNCKLETFRYDHGGEHMIKPRVRPYACDLTLDPNTAHRELFLSKGNRRVTHVRKKQPYPKHPERFDFWPQVLCREGLSDHCYWEVEWRGDVVIGVAYESIQRKGINEDRFGRNDKSWCLYISGDSGYSISTMSDKYTPPLASLSGCSRVRVCLDWAAGTLSFNSVPSDPPNLLHMFRTTFTQPVYPAFWVDSDSSVSLFSDYLMPAKHRQRQKHWTGLKLQGKLACLSSEEPYHVSHHSPKYLY